MSNSPKDAPSTTISSSKGVLAVVSLLMGFASISTDLYLPAMPQMAATLHTSQGTIALTVSGYLVGFSLAQLVWGPVSDHYGRRLPIAIGLVLFILGSAGCAMATGVGLLVAFRLIQALGACASVALSRAMVRDLYSGQRAAQMMSTLMTVMAIAPLLGPLLGGQISALVGWRAIFWVLVAIGIIALAALFTIAETLPLERRHPNALKGALRNYLNLARQPRLLAFIGTGGFFYGGMFAYVAGTPFAYISYYGVPEQLYGLIFAAGILGIMASNMMNIRLVKRFGIRRMLSTGTLIAMLAGAVTAVDGYTDWGGLWGIALPLFVAAAASGLVIANAMAGALEDYPRQAGAVSAMTGASQYGCGVLGSGLVGLLFDGTPGPMGLVVAGASLLAWLSALAVNALHRRYSTHATHCT